MFSHHYKSAWLNTAELAVVPAAEFDAVDYRNAKQCASVLWTPGFGAGGDLDRTILAKSFETKRSLHQNRVFSVVPLYVSSCCAEQCVYCNYRAGNVGVGVARKRLSEAELRAEATFLIEEKGLRVIELVYASDPKMTADIIAGHIEFVRNLLEQHGGGTVGLSCEALDEAEYRLLANVGLSFSVLWMETYDAERYHALHPGRLRKSRFEYRLDAYERMIAAEIPAVGMGILSGLADWRREWAMLMKHETYLQKKCGRGAVILGIPRLKRAPGAAMHGSEFIPTTQEFIATLALHNCFASAVMPFVSTREDWETCIQIAQGGGCLFTLNCSTIPGGYSLNTYGAQFANNSFDAPVFAPRLRELGFSPVFQWTAEDLCRVQTPPTAV